MGKTQLGVNRRGSALSPLLGLSRQATTPLPSLPPPDPVRTLGTNSPSDSPDLGAGLRQVLGEAAQGLNALRGAKPVPADRAEHDSQTLGAQAPGPSRPRLL